MGPVARDRSLRGRRRVCADGFLFAPHACVLDPSLGNEGEAGASVRADALATVGRGDERSWERRNVYRQRAHVDRAGIHDRPLRVRGCGAVLRRANVRRPRRLAARVSDRRRDGLRRRDEIPRAVGLPHLRARLRCGARARAACRRNAFRRREGSDVKSLDALSERYGEHHRTARSEDFVFAGPERVELFRRYVGGPGRRVLDLGCRYGALTRSYLAGNEVVGVDVDRDALAEAAKLGIETHWANVDEPLPFANESFDAVVAGELLEHVRDPRRLVDEASRVLRGGGTFIASVPNAFRLKNRLRFLLCRKPETDPTHLHMFSPADVRSLLGGFDDPELRFIAGRLVPLNARLFANDIVFTARRP